MSENKKVKIAITGTIGSGKSTVSKYLSEKGYCVFDCDEVNKKLLKTRAYELLYNDFCECFTNRTLDKAKLSEIVFTNSDKRLKLESIMHPLILNELNSINNDLIFAEVPLLFETNWDKYFDSNLLVISDKDISLERLYKRGLCYLEANKRIDSQMPVSEKMKKADEIIYNNGTLFDLYQKIDEWLNKLGC